MTNTYSELTIKLMRRLRKLNEAQITAIANLLLEIGKWLLLSVVFSSLFIQNSATVDTRAIIVAVIAVLVIIIVAIWILKEVKKHD